jgi:DNA-binding NarL/FixJ family response regulator
MLGGITNKLPEMTRKIRVAILDDHQSIVDGYIYRLSGNPQIEVVANMACGDDLEPTLVSQPDIDVLILDVNVPTSSSNVNPYPILHVIPNLLQKFPALNILVISVFAERGLIRSLAKAGVSGYILKDDQAVIRDLADVVLSVADGGIRFSPKAHLALLATDDLRPSARLSGRQLEALSLCAAYPNQTTAQLAQMMSVSNSTVRNLLSSAYMKLGVGTRAAALERAHFLGLITPRAATSPPR